MIRITIVEPVALPANLTSAASPIWQDGQGRQYRVASGLGDAPPEMAWRPEDGDMPVPDPETAVIIAGMDGLEALDAMGLSRIVDDPMI